MVHPHYISSVPLTTMILALMYVPVPSIGFFHRFCDFKLNRISETLSLEEKSLSLAKNPFILMGGNWDSLEFRRKILIFGENPLSLENFLSLTKIGEKKPALK